jgi:hypothetical protein
VGTKADDGAHHCGIFALIGGVELRFSGCLLFLLYQEKKMMMSI